MSSTDVKATHIYNGLYKVLAEHFPDFRTKTNSFDVPGFAKGMKKSHETAYKALRRDSLTLVIAESIIEFSRNCTGAIPLVWNDLLPFVLPNFEEFSTLPGENESPADDDFDLG